MQTNSDQPVPPAEANDSRTASDKAVVCKELLGCWWVVDRNHDDLKHRGPYKHAETAGAVRSEMERTASERMNEYWNLAVVRIETHSHNPSHAIGTCGKCGEEMVYNVPRLGPDGGYVHKATGKLQCEQPNNELKNAGH